MTREGAASHGGFSFSLLENSAIRIYLTRAVGGFLTRLFDSALGSLDLDMNLGAGFCAFLGMFLGVCLRGLCLGAGGLVISVPCMWHRDMRSKIRDPRSVIFIVKRS